MSDAEPKSPSRLERYGMLGILLVQFGWHETRMRALESDSARHGSAIATVAAATDERRDALAQSLSRIEQAQDESSKSVRELRDTVIEMRAAMRRPR